MKLKLKIKNFLPMLHGYIFFFITLFCENTLVNASTLHLDYAQFTPKEIEDNLAILHKDPVAFRQILPSKKTRISPLIEVRLESKGQIQRELFIHKMRSREKILYGRNDKSGFGMNDQVENFLESGPIIKKLQEMEDMNLSEGKIDIQPWSDNYWPIYRGITGARYANEQFNELYTWPESYDFIKKNPAIEIFQKGDPASIDTLSPAEKYDLLLSTDQTPLTEQSWKEGSSYYNRDGKVEDWMGICHGWAPASYMSPRPKKKITVIAADGKTPINFYPSDIKALTSLIWAKVDTPTRFIGGRCNDENPQLDNLGRPILNDCLDTNPGTWHMSVVNKIGVKKRSFIMDATFDYEVWNQPVLAYSFSYFNLEDKKISKKWQEVVIPLAEYSNDRYKKYRSPAAKRVIGVNMEVTYLAENMPEHEETNNFETDHTITVLYTYDLELNDKGEIVGGEWYKNSHPDFLWTPESNAKPLTSHDYYLMGEKKWDGKAPLKSSWTEMAKKSALRGRPLYKIVESLIDLSLQ